jgi:hypothetical protein
MSGLDAVVAQVPSTLEAELIVGLLETNGIEAAVSSDDAGGNEPQLQLTQGVRVVVAPEDEADARRLIEEVGSEQT